MCWAARLGGCGGPISAEHVVTESLFGKRIRVQGATRLWLGGVGTVETSIRKLKANILCRDHNNELGRTADFAALRLLGHFRASHRPMDLPGACGPRPPVVRRASGVNFGRWLCKTHCNSMVVNRLTPDPNYARYAFLRPTSRPVHFFFAGALGENLRLADGRDPVVSWTRLVADEDASFDAFSIALAGFETVVSTVPLERNFQEMIESSTGLVSRRFSHEASNDGRGPELGHSSALGWRRSFARLLLRQPPPRPDATAGPSRAPPRNEPAMNPVPWCQREVPAPSVSVIG